MLDIHSKATFYNHDQIPYLAIGVYQVPKAYPVVSHALKVGYRHVDTAKLYANEADCGRAIRDSGIPREEIFVTTKLWNGDQGTENTEKAILKSLEQLDIGYIDLYLIHSPLLGKELRLQSYAKIIEFQKRGLIKNIGVSNYGIHHLEELLQHFPDDPPVCNQIEIHPWNTRTELAKYCREKNIVVVAYCSLARGQKFDDKTLIEIAEKYQRSLAHILLRWALQHGYVILPKSEKPERIESNSHLYDFEISDQDMETLDGLNEGFVAVWDPTTCP